MGTKGGVPDVLRLANLLRMSVLWLLYLIYSHLSYLVLRLRSSPELKPLDSHLLSFAQSKPACIVTGASSGIGRATAFSLAHRGFHVILAGRSLERLEVVRGEIEAGNSTASCQALALDLCSVPSILSFVHTVRELFEAPDAPGTFQLLVNNAGMLASSRRWTEDGVDGMMASNYLGPYMLTQELLPLLQKNAPKARIVNLVSFTHRACKDNQILLHKGATHGGGMYPLARIYETSKLFMTLYSYELHRQNRGVSVMAADPGAVSTNILREVPSWLAHLSSLVLGLLGLLQSPSAGASAVVAACLAPWEVSGKYVFGNPGLFCTSSPLSYDQHLGRRLWEASESLLKWKGLPLSTSAVPPQKWYI